MLERSERWLLTLGLFVLVANLDIFAGRASMALGWMIATCIAAWLLREGEALAVGVAGVIVAGIIAHVQWVTAGPGNGLTDAQELWDVLARAVSISMVVLLVNGVRCVLEIERWRAATDGLTGVLNKQAFETRMARAVAAAREKGRSVVFAFMDLDGFKAVNDAHGHGAGDAVLRVFAQGASEMVRTTDLFARVGGDEFAALLMVPSCAHGDRLAGMLHARLSGVLARTGYPVTCSMGALVVPKGLLADHQGFVALADGLMYEVKHSGKNAIRVARAGSPGVPTAAVSN